MDQSKVVQHKGSFKLKNAIAGKSNYLEYFKQEERIVYQSDFQTIKIVPILHTNVISFFAMKKRSSYLGFRKVGDNLIGLEKSGSLTTWNSSTGMIKFTMPQICANLNLKNYSIFQHSLNDKTYLMDWYPETLLLVNKMEAIKDVN